MLLARASDCILPLFASLVCSCFVSQHFAILYPDFLKKGCFVSQILPSPLLNQVFHFCLSHTGVESSSPGL